MMPKKSQPTFGNGRFTCIAGPCILEESFDALAFAKELKEITNAFPVDFIFKASFDKANRSSIDAYRGPGIEEGLKTLATIREQLSVPVITDVHETWQVAHVQKVVDAIQIPAFLCRQTDLLVAAAQSNCWVNVKKGQFLSPPEIHQINQKLQAYTNSWSITERGTSFGYQNLVVDFRGIRQMLDTGVPIIYDVTHSMQLPGANSTHTGGTRQYARYLARAATVCEVDGLFMEVHPNPEQARSDATTQLTVSEFKTILSDVCALRATLNSFPETK